MVQEVEGAQGGRCVREVHGVKTRCSGCDVLVQGGGTTVVLRVGTTAVTLLHGEAWALGNELCVAAARAKRISTDEPATTG